MIRIFGQTSSLLLCLAIAVWSAGLDRAFGEDAGTAGNVFESVGKAFESLIGRGYNLGAAGDALSAIRTIEDRYPVGASATIFLDHEFGAVRMSCWDQRVVECVSKVSATAESRESAAAAIETVVVQAESTADTVNIRALPPALAPSPDALNIRVDVELTVPRDADVLLQERFGDLDITGLDGNLRADVWYGAVRLKSMGGPVDLRARGSQPLTVLGLRQGGTFCISDMDASFRDIAGETRILMFGGSLAVEGLGHDAALDITAKGGSVRLSCAPETDPNVNASVRFGKLVTDWPEITSGGLITTLRHEPPGARQRVTLDATFCDVTLERGPGEQVGGQIPRSYAGMSMFRETVSRTEMVDSGATLTVEANAGSVRIEGADVTQVAITEERTVWAASAVEAPQALERVEVRTFREPGQLMLTTNAPPSADPLAPRVRVDLVVQCPKTLPVRATVRDGSTVISGMATPVEVHQEAGHVQVVDVAGDIAVRSANGGVEAIRCAGEMNISTEQGDVLVRENSGNAALACTGGRILVDAPRAAIAARATSGDVRILAVEGLYGDIEATAQSGNISIALPEAPDVDLSVTAAGGVVYSALPLTGSVSKDRQEFHVLIKDGRHRLRLEARDGDVHID